MCQVGHALSLLDASAVTMPKMDSSVRGRGKVGECRVGVAAAGDFAKMSDELPGAVLPGVLKREVPACLA
jgi:hypothetical protein